MVVGESDVQAEGAKVAEGGGGVPLVPQVVFVSLGGMITGGEGLGVDGKRCS